MTKKTEYKGFWWLPDKPDKQVAGQMTISVNGEVTLELQDSLADEPNTYERLNPIILILGLSDLGQKITLYECITTHSTYNSAGFSAIKLQANKTFIGVHFRNEDEMRFRQLSVQYAHLEEWVDCYDVDIQLNTGKLIIQLEQLTTSDSMHVNGYQVLIRKRYQFNRKRTEIKLTPQAWIDCLSESAKSFDEFYSFLRHIQNFLSLGMGVPTYPLEIEGITDTSIAENNQKRCTIFCPTAEWIDRSETVLAPRMLFVFTSLRERLESYLTNWINKAELLGPVYDLFFATRFNPYIYCEHAFLSLIQAVETYHRRRFGGKYLTDDEYQQGLYRKFIDVIPPNINNEFRLSLIEGKLKFANEYSLRKRLQELLHRIGPSLPNDFLASKKDRNNFIREVCDTRNYLTHYNPELQRKVAQPSKLSLNTQRLTIILEVCLLEELGLNPEMTKDIITKRYKNLLH